MADGPNQLSLDDFANKIKAKYPQYKDLSNAALARRMLQAYPQYRDQVHFDHALADPSESLSKLAHDFGLKITSNLRSPQHNAAVGGAPSSYHLKGEAYDVAGDPEKMRQFYDRVRDTYGGELAEVLNEGNHIHVAWSGSGGAGQRVSNKKEVVHTNPRLPGGGWIEGGESKPQPQKNAFAGASAGVQVASPPADETPEQRSERIAGRKPSFEQPEQWKGAKVSKRDPSISEKAGFGLRPFAEENIGQNILSASGRPFQWVDTAVEGIAHGVVSEVRKAAHGKFQDDPRYSVEGVLRAAGTAFNTGEVPEGFENEVPKLLDKVADHFHINREQAAYVIAHNTVALGTSPSMLMGMAEGGLKAGRMEPESVLPKEAERVGDRGGPRRVITKEATNLRAVEPKAEVKPTLTPKVAKATIHPAKPTAEPSASYRPSFLTDPEEVSDYKQMVISSAQQLYGETGEPGLQRIERPDGASDYIYRNKDGKIVAAGKSTKAGIVSDIAGESRMGSGRIIREMEKDGVKFDPQALSPESAKLLGRHAERAMQGDASARVSSNPPKAAMLDLGSSGKLPSSFQKGNLNGQGVNPNMPPPGGTGTVADELAHEEPEPEKGMSRGAEVGSFVRSQDRVLSSYDSTRPISSILTGAQDKASAWISTTLRQASEPLHGLSRRGRFNVGKILDTYDDPQLAPANLYSASEIGAAVRVKQVLNQIWSQAQMQAPLGKISSYWTHIERAVGSDPSLLKGIQQTIEYHMGGKGMRKWFSDWFKQEELSGQSGGAVVDTIRTPDSPFRRARTGALTDIDYDPRRVLPAYIESMAKVIHDRPALEQARGIVEDMPPSRLREYAEKSIRNFSNFSVYPEFQQAWDRFGGWIGRQTGRAMVGFYPGIQTLHLARVPLLLTEMKPMDWAAGVAEVARHPIASFQEVARMGLLPNFVEPWDMMHAGGKLDAVANLFGVADFLDRAIAYKGFSRQFLREGMTAQEAHWKAISESKKMSFFVDRTRAVGAFTGEGGYGAVTRLAMQFKHQPIKMVEYFTSVAQELRANPMKAARLAAITTGLMLTAQQSGLRVWHLGPTLLELSGASFSVVTKAVQKLAKGDVEGALAEILAWSVPGGYEIERIGKGTAFGQEQEKPKPKPTLVPRKKSGKGLGHL